MILEKLLSSNRPHTLAKHRCGFILSFINFVWLPCLLQAHHLPCHLYGTILPHDSPHCYILDLPGQLLPHHLTCPLLDIAPVWFTKLDNLDYCKVYHLLLLQSRVSMSVYVCIASESMIRSSMQHLKQVCLNADSTGRPLLGYWPPSMHPSIPHVSTMQLCQRCLEALHSCCAVLCWGVLGCAVLGCAVLFCTYTPGS